MFPFLRIISVNNFHSGSHPSTGHLRLVEYHLRDKYYVSLGFIHHLGFIRNRKIPKFILGCFWYYSCTEIESEYEHRKPDQIILFSWTCSDEVIVGAIEPGSGFLCTRAHTQTHTGVTCSERLWLCPALGVAPSGLLKWGSPNFSRSHSGQRLWNWRHLLRVPTRFNMVCSTFHVAHFKPIWGQQKKYPHCLSKGLTSKNLTSFM